MKYLWSFIIFAVSLLVFEILEYGRLTLLINELIQPLIFSSSVVLIFLSHKFKQLSLWFSLILLALMVVFYLFNLLLVANWVGSLGFGVLVISIFSYLPSLIKYGHI